MEGLSEREVAATYTGDFAWPTIVLFVALMSAYVSIIFLGVSHTVPLWACMLINGVLAYSFYTIHHEANHGNISGRYRRFRWIDEVLGNAAAIPLQLNFVPYARSHLLHHAHTNVPERDPDFFMAGPGRAIVPRWAVSTVLKTLLSVPGLNRVLPAALPEPLASAARDFTVTRRGMMRYNQVCLVVLVGSYALGVGNYVLFLWWLPAQIGALLLQVWFVWLPHRDFDETARYRNTRIRTWFGSTILLLGQDYHLIHHLYPRVPFYRYRSLFGEIRTSLEVQGARIEVGLRAEASSGA